MLDLLLPQRCLGCSRPGSHLCDWCRTTLPRLRDPLCERCGAPTAWPVARCRECAGRRLAFALGARGSRLRGRGPEARHELEGARPAAARGDRGGSRRRDGGPPGRCGARVRPARPRPQQPAGTRSARAARARARRALGAAGARCARARPARSRASAGSGSRSGGGTSPARSRPARRSRPRSRSSTTSTRAARPLRPRRAPCAAPVRAGSRSSPSRGRFVTLRGSEP